MLEVRTVAIMIVAKFEIYIDPSSKRPSRCVDDIQDCFTASAGNLKLVFKPLAYCDQGEKPSGFE